MNYIDLFSGLGGFALGAYWAGMKFEHHYFSEVEPYAVELYQKRFPDAIPLGDIREIDCEKLADTERQTISPQTNRGTIGRRKGPAMGDEHRTGGKEWIITGGFPCQDISVAGKGEGIGGSRSGLWFEMWRIIRELRPRFVIAENVGALTFRGMDAVLSSLAEIGYDAEWQDIRAEDMGAPHRRERIWIVAYPHRERRSELELSQPDMEHDVCEPSQLRYRKREAESEVAHPSRELLNRSGASGQGRRRQSTDGSGEVPDTPSNGRERTGLRRQESPRATGENQISNPDGPGLEAGGPSMPSGREETYPVHGITDQQNGRHGGWAAEPSVCRVASRLPDELDAYQGRLAHNSFKRVDRLKGLGNSIIPQIAQLLFERIMEVDNVRVHADKGERQEDAKASRHYGAASGEGVGAE